MGFPWQTDCAIRWQMGSRVSLVASKPAYLIPFKFGISLGVLQAQQILGHTECDSVFHWHYSSGVENLPISQIWLGEYDYTFLLKDKVCVFVSVHTCYWIPIAITATCLPQGPDCPSTAYFILAKKSFRKQGTDQWAKIWSKWIDIHLLQPASLTIS